MWFCCCCILFVVVLCLVCPMLPVSLDYPFSIAASVFSNVYFLCSFFILLHAEHFFLLMLQKLCYFSGQFERQVRRLGFWLSRVFSKTCSGLMNVKLTDLPEIFLQWFWRSVIAFWSDSKSEIATLAFDWQRHALWGFLSSATAYKFTKLTRNNSQVILKNCYFYSKSKYMMTIQASCWLSHFL